MSVVAQANPKQQAHELLDQFDASQLAAVVHLLEATTEAHRQSLAVAQSPQANEDQDFINAVSETTSCG